MTDRPRKPPRPADRPSSPRFKSRKGKTKTLGYPPIRDLIRAAPSLEEANKAWEEIRTGTPRAAATVAASIVHNAISWALRMRCWEEPPFKFDELLDPPGPLSSFYSCIDMAFALGVFGPVFRGDLHVVRRIRNGFAHAQVPVTFDTPHVVGEIVQFKYLPSLEALGPVPYEEHHTPGIIEFVRNGAKPTITNREKYTVTCELLWDQIMRWGSGDYLSRARKPQLP
jgi:hypothetical protein